MHQHFDAVLAGHNHIFKILRKTKL